MRLYDDLCRITGQRHDPCLLDTFIAAVRYMEGGPKKPGGRTRRNGNENWRHEAQEPVVLPIASASRTDDAKPL